MTWKLETARSTASAFTVRSFEREDIPQLLELMIGLAEFEDYRDAFAVQERDLIDRGLGADPQFYAKVAVSEDGILLGMAVYYLVPFTYDLHPDLVLKELFVRSDARGAGVGQALLDELIEAAKASDCKRIKWLVLASNDPAKRFYETLGGRQDEKWELWQLQVAPRLSKGAR